MRHLKDSPVFSGDQCLLRDEGIITPGDDTSRANMRIAVWLTPYAPALLLFSTNVCLVSVVASKQSCPRSFQMCLNLQFSTCEPDSTSRWTFFQHILCQRSGVSTLIVSWLSHYELELNPKISKTFPCMPCLIWKYLIKRSVLCFGFFIVFFFSSSIKPGQLPLNEYKQHALKVTRLTVLLLL